MERERMKNKELPVFICVCCKKFMFRRQVHEKEFNAKGEMLKEMLEGEKHIVCKTCNSYVCKEAIPHQAMINNLEMDKAAFEKLNTLEQHLISPVLPFYCDFT